MLEDSPPSLCTQHRPSRSGHALFHSRTPFELRWRHGSPTVDRRRMPATSPSRRRRQCPSGRWRTLQQFQRCHGLRPSSERRKVLVLTMTWQSRQWRNNLTDMSMKGWTTQNSCLCLTYVQNWTQWTRPLVGRNCTPNHTLGSCQFFFIIS